MSDRSDWQTHVGIGERQVRYGVNAGTARDIPMFREDNGQLGGKQTEHWDGHVDATIIAPTINLNARTGEVS